MAIPKLHDLTLPLLEMLAAAGGELSHSALVDQLAERFNLTEAERELRHRKGGQRIFRNSRVGYAKLELKLAGLIMYSNGGPIRISRLGRIAMADSPRKIDRVYLRPWQEKFAEQKDTKEKLREHNDPFSVEASEADERQLGHQAATGVRLHRQQEEKRTMAIPTRWELTLPVLEKLDAAGGELSHSTIVDQLAEQFNLTTTERNEVHPKGNKKFGDIEVGFAKLELKNAGLVAYGDGTMRPTRITGRGRRVLWMVRARGEPQIDQDFLRPLQEEWETKEQLISMAFRMNHLVSNALAAACDMSRSIEQIGKKYMDSDPLFCNFIEDWSEGLSRFEEEFGRTLEFDL